MATDLEKLVVQLSADVRQFEKSLARMQGVSNKQFNAIERRARQMNKNLDGIFARSFRGLTAPLAGIGAALGTRELMRLADTWSDLNSRVRNAAGGIEAGNEVMERLGEVARRTYSSLEQTAEGYLLNATAMRELGYSSGQTLDYVESVNNALVVSGAKGQVAQRVMEALAKAMALGELRGENLNTVIQSGGRVAEALAAGLGVTTNQLRALGMQGKITGRDMIRALSSQMEKLRKEAEEMPATISDGIQLLQNALLEYVGNADQATGVSAKISEALVVMADNFDKTADVALQLAGVIAGALVGRSLLKMISTLGLAGTALANFTRALAAARTMAGLATAFGGLSAAAGPVGLVIGGAVVSSLVLFSNSTSDASAGADRFAARLDALKDKAEDSAEAVEAAGERYNEALKNALTHEVAAAGDAFDDAREAALGLLNAAIETAPALKIVRDEAGNMSRQPMASPEQIADLERIRDELEKNAGGAKEAKNELFALANANPNFQTLADQMQPLLDTLALVAQGARDAKAELAAVSGMEGAGVSATAQRSGPGQARRALQARKEESRLWEQEQTRRAKLGKDQLALENEIARVKKQAADDGIRVTEDQIKRIAEANLAGNAARSAEGKKPKKERDDEYERLAARIRESTTALQAETAALAGLNPLVEDYGYAVEKARATQELLTAAKKAGIAITPELRQKIDELADGYANATVSANQLAEAQDKVRESAEEMRALGKDVLGGFIKDIRNGVSAADALSNALGKVADKLLDMALNNLFSGGSGRGGLLGGFLIPGILHGGGVAGRDGYGHGRAVSPSVFAGARRYHKGGIAGLQPGEVPAILQRGEVVLPRGSKMGGGGTSVVINAPINAPGADAAALARVEASVKELGRNIPKMVDQRVNTRQTRGTRP